MAENDENNCRQPFRHFSNLLNRAVYRAAVRRNGKCTRVSPVLEKDEMRLGALRSWERGAAGRWHIHRAIELREHLDAIALEDLIRASWAKLNGLRTDSCSRQRQRGLDQLYVKSDAEVLV
jgi:hypothetical protein